MNKIEKEMEKMKKVEREEKIEKPPRMKRKQSTKKKNMTIDMFFKTKSKKNENEMKETTIFMTKTQLNLQKEITEKMVEEKEKEKEKQSFDVKKFYEIFYNEISRFNEALSILRQRENEQIKDQQTTTFEKQKGAKRPQRESSQSQKKQSLLNKELTYEEQIIENWIRAEIHLFQQQHHFDGNSMKNIAVLFQYKTSEMSYICSKHSVKHISMDISQVEQHNSEKIDENHFILYEIDIVTKEDLSLFLSFFSNLNEGLYVLNCSSLFIEDYSEIIASIGLFLPLKDGTEFLVDQLKEITLFDGLNIHKNHLKKLFTTFQYVPNHFFFILHSLNLMKKGVCHFPFQNELSGPIQLLNKLTRGEITIDQMLVYCQRNDELKKFVYCHSWITQPPEIFMEIQKFYCTADIYEKTKPSKRTETVNDLISLHNVVFPHFLSTGMISTDSNKMEEDNENNEIEQNDEDFENEMEEDEDSSENEMNEIEEKEEKEMKEEKDDQDIGLDDHLDPRTTKEIVQMEKRMDLQKQQRHRVLNSRMLTPLHMFTKEQSTSLVIPTIINILSSKKAKTKKGRKEIVRQFEEQGIIINPKVWRIMINNTSILKRISHLDKSHRQFIFSFFDKYDFD